jgi:hypothetical protein
VTYKKRSARVAAASFALATGAALVGVGAAMAEPGDTPAAPETGNQGQSDEDHGEHLGWAKLHTHANNGKHTGWDQHGQHGGAPAPEAEEPTEAPGKSGEPHGQSAEPHGQAGEDHGKAGLNGEGAEKGQAGQDHGKAGQKP